MSLPAYLDKPIHEVIRDVMTAIPGISAENAYEVYKEMVIETDCEAGWVFPNYSEIQHDLWHRMTQTEKDLVITRLNCAL